MNILDVLLAEVERLAKSYSSMYVSAAQSWCPAIYVWNRGTAEKGGLLIITATITVKTKAIEISRYFLDITLYNGDRRIVKQIQLDCSDPNMFMLLDETIGALHEL